MLMGRGNSGFPRVSQRLATAGIRSRTCYVLRKSRVEQLSSSVTNTGDTICFMKIIDIDSSSAERATGDCGDEESSNTTKLGS
jgi:hypothetical protein